jgi:hypothetical protein
MSVLSVKVLAGRVRGVDSPRTVPCFIPPRTVIPTRTKFVGKNAGATLSRRFRSTTVAARWGKEKSARAFSALRMVSRRSEEVIASVFSSGFIVDLAFFSSPLPLRERAGGARRDETDRSSFDDSNARSMTAQMFMMDPSNHNPAGTWEVRSPGLGRGERRELVVRQRIVQARDPEQALLLEIVHADVAAAGGLGGEGEISPIG